MVNYFRILNLDPAVEIDLDLLEKRLIILQNQYHPDKIVGKSEAEKDLSLEKSQEINQAFHILKDPYERLKHFLEINGIDINNLQMPDEFLIETMIWREELL